MKRSDALNWMRWIAFVNLGFGALLWIVNSMELESGDLTTSEALDTIAWQNAGTGMWTFGLLVFVIFLATTAIIGAPVPKATPEAPKPPQCPGCYVEIMADAKFCTNCGQATS